MGPFHHELKEMLTLAAIYCGMPAANAAFGRARKFIAP
jgi:alkylhydroperoxidase/carboxymuconolactone decarboxylase family protein YurZ